MVSCPDRDIRRLPVGGKERRPHGEASARSARKLVRGESITAIDGESWQAGAADLERDSRRARLEGTTSFSRGRPPGRPLLLVSGDVNQGREMQVLA